MVNLYGRQASEVEEKGRMRVGVEKQQGVKQVVV